MSVPAAEQMQQGGMIQHTLLPACPVLKIKDLLSLNRHTERKGLGRAGGDSH